MGELAEALIEHLRKGANLLRGVGREDALNADADDDGARREAAVSEDGAEARGDGGANQAQPQRWLTQQRAAGFSEHIVAGQPEIGELGGNDLAVLVNIASEQLGIEAGLEHGLGLGGVFIADDVDERQACERFCAGASGLAHLGVGIAQHGIQVDGVGCIAAGERCGAAARLAEYPDDEADGQRAEQAKDHAEQDELGAFKMQGESAPDDEGQINQEDEYPNQHAFHRDTSERLVDNRRGGVSWAWVTEDCSCTAGTDWPSTKM